ncbi:hypothetical protein RFI_40293, partial [Reticulomyxa filosa]
NNIGNSNVICSGSNDNTIRFWDIRSNENELHMIKGDEQEEYGIFCLKFIELKKKENVTYDLNLCYGSGKCSIHYVFYFTLLFKKFEKAAFNICIKYRNKLQDISSVVFFV